jgi:ubiquinone/menaquinone biosynthesis C-methylase UbiE
MKSIYDFPEIFEVVMARPPDVVPTEVNSIHELLGRRGVRSGRILELACGTCAHGIPLAGLGHTVVGVDRSAAMLQTAAQNSTEQGVHLHLVQANVVDFNLGASDFDCALFMFETFPVITALEEIVQHFAAVRRHLKQSALYIVDLDPRKRGVGIETGEWGHRTLSIPNGTVENWYEDRPGDWIENTSHLLCHCRITRQGEVIETRDEWRLRVYSPWDLRLLVQTLPGWRLDGFYSWRDLSDRIATEQHYWMVLEAQ